MFKVGDKVVVVNHTMFNGIQTEITAISHNGKLHVYHTPIFNFFESEIALIQPFIQDQSHPYPINTFSELIDNNVWFNPGILAENIFNKKCECGSHAVGVDRHSDYCPLYSKD